MEELKNEEINHILEKKETCTLYLFTPLCGTCQVAGKILSVVEELLPSLKMYKADLNYFPKLAEDFQIESVPCLLLFQNGKCMNKIYAFQSVPFIYEKLKNLIS